jgi:hypothetical protein
MSALKREQLLQHLHAKRSISTVYVASHMPHVLQRLITSKYFIQITCCKTRSQCVCELTDFKATTIHTLQLQDPDDHRIRKRFLQLFISMERQVFCGNIHRSAFEKCQKDDENTVLFSHQNYSESRCTCVCSARLR